MKLKLYIIDRVAGLLWAMPVPFASMGYGAVVFFKKFYPKDSDR